MNRHRLFIVFVLATVVAFVIGLRHAEMQSSTLRRITNTSEEGINLNPSISGDGRVIGFESTEDVASAGGTDHFRAIRANITGDPASFFQIAGSRLIAPAISQDGSRIAFASRDDLLGTNSDGNSEIFLFDGAKLIQATNTAPGSLTNRITNGNFQPSISDDGRFIAFSSNRDLAGQNSDGNLEIFVYDSVASTFAQLTNSSGIVGASDAKISGNGTAIAFIRDSGASPSTARDLMKQPRAGGSATILVSSVPSLAMTYGRAISDDGARVVYSSETATNTTQVFMFDGRSGGTIRQITSLGARVTEVPLDPTISGDGSRIAFAARRTVSGAGSNSDGGVELYVYDFPTTTFSKITNAPSSATAEVVSSLNDDGSIIAFNFPRVLSGAVTNSGTENNSEIYAIAPPARPANGALTAILNDASFGHEPSTTKAIAPNSIALAQGTNLANTTAQSQRLADGTFPTNVGGTRVTVNGRAAQIFFVSPTQINFLVPSQTEIGTAEVIVTNPENFPARGTVSILRAAPGVFTKTGDGIGEGVILNAETLQEGPFDPTGGNLRLSIFATGARNASATTVSIGGRVVNAEAVLPSNTMPGLDEVHVRVPADLRGAGTVNLTVNSDGRDSNPVTVSFVGDPSRAILFNEVLSDPPNGIAGDANNDGVRDTTDDEFVEFVNGSSAENIGMSGWTVKTRATGSTTETTRFTFPAGTSLAPGTAAVVFGGGAFNATDPIFGCAQIFRATSASSGLSLTNTGLTILLRDSAGNLISQFSYGGSTGLDGNNSQSLTRSPDITGSFVLHTTANAARRFSPGLKVDGTPFGNCAGHPATVTISPTSTSVNQGQSTQFNAQTFDQFGRAMTGVPITFTSDNTTVATIDSTSTNPSNGVVTANVGTHNPGVAHITASSTDGTTTANSSPATLTVVGPALSVNDVSKNEGNAGTTTFTFTVSLTLPAPSSGVKFDIATQDGTATVANNDYVARTLTNQVIPAGAQTYSFDVTVNGDTAIEPNENFFVSVSNVSGASVTKGQGTGTIANDDSPTLSISDVSANEGDSGTTAFTFTVTTPVVAGAGGITFDIATADGTATAASGDYVARALTSQTIPAGQSSYTFDVTVNGDTLVESNETFFVNITNVSGATVNDGQGQGTIQNDDTPNLAISQIYPGGGLSSATYTNDFIELYNRGTTTVDFSITPYSAQFLSTTGSTWVKTDLTSGVIGPGRYFLIREASGGANGSSLPAADATGTINLTSTTDGKVALVFGATLLAGSCPGDDGTQPFNPINVADFVGYGGTSTTANHCYEGTGPSSFALGNNTIADFRKAGGCVDTNDNATDFFTAQPSPRNTASPIGDCKPEITINDVTVTEGNSGTATATFTVTLAATSAQTINVDFATANGTATAPSDYQSNNGTLTFNPGDLTKTITVLVNGDTMDEPNETFFVNLANAVNAVILDSQGQGTINDNDAAPSVSINDATVTEGNSGTASATFTVSLSAASGFTVTVNYATADNSATAGSDYQTASGAVTFNPGETSKPISTTVFGDTDFEQNETFFVNLSTPVNVTIADGQGIGTINNDDPLPSTPNFFIDDVSISEGDAGTKTANFTVTLTPAATQQVTVQYATANGTATAGSDYQSTSGTLTFDPGETSKPVSVTINGDTMVEPDETFFINLSNPSAGTNLGDSQGAGTIQNDDQPSLVISQVYPGGGLSGATYANDFIELYNRANTTVDFSVTPYSVQFLSTSGSTWAKTDLSTGSIAPGHYFLIREASGGAVGASLPAADATGTINLTSTTAGKVALVGNTTLLTSNCPGDDSAQPFNPTGSPIADFAGYLGSAATANHCYEGSGPASFTSGNNTIADFRKAGGCVDTNDNANDFFVATPNPRNSASPIGDCKPEIIINDVTVTEGNTGTVNATFTVTLTATSSQTVTVDFATADGTATTPADYQSNNGQLTFAPGDTTKTITVLVNGDTLDEANETFFVNLTNPANALIVDAQGLGTTNDNDPQPSLSINDVSIAEGDSGTTTLNFTVSLSTASGQAVTVNYATADTTATAPSDYQTTSGAVTFNAGDTAKQVSVLINGDTDFEQTETFFVNLSGATNASISDNQGIGTITNDDAAPPTPTFFIDDVSVSEGNSGTTTATFTVTLSPASNVQTTVDYATANGPAIAASDYQSTSGTLTFGIGETSKQVSVTINGDTLVEPDETFLVNLTNATGGAAIGDNQGLGTILNDDVAAIAISQVYAGGGNTSAPAAVYKNDFIEIFNRGTTTVDLAGWSVQYSSAGGTGNWSVTQLCSLSSCLLSPGQYFLIQEAQGAGGTQNLPTPDATGTIAMATASGKVALVSNTTPLAGACPGTAGILDKVGYGGTSGTTNFCFEGTGPTSAPSNVDAAFRKAGGCTDTNDNAADFFTFGASPRNSTSPTNNCSGGATPNLSIDDVTVAEGNSGATTATFTVSLSAPAQGADVTFDIATQDNSATTANNDYVTKSLTNQIIPAGQTSYTFTVTISGDVAVEPDESFFVNVANVVGANVADGQSTGTIQHDDLPTLSIDDVAAAEGDSGTTTFTFHVTLSDPAPATVSFDIATADGTAQDHNPISDDNDYQARSIAGQTIAQGASSFDFAVTVNGDTTNESNETFFVNVTNASGAAISDGAGLGTIQNDDAPPDLSIGDVTQAEGNAGTSTFNFTVNLSAPAKAGGVSFTINTADGSSNPATAGNDYVAIVNGSGSIPEGSSSTTVAVTVNGDTVFEPNETFFVNLSSVTGANVIDSQGLGTITNDDAQPTLAIADASITEGNSGTSTMTFTVTMTGASQSAVTVNYATSDSSATVADTDYDTASGMLTFAPGDTSKTFNVTIHGDTNAEGDEMFLVDLSSPSGATISDGQALGIIFLDDPFSIAAVNTAYTENFDVLAQTGVSATTPTAWTRAESGTNANMTYTANNGSSTTGDTYSYGSVALPTDRALGGLRTGSPSLVPIVGAFYRNDTGSTVNSLTIAYNGEEWRLGSAGRTDRLDFQYSTNATSLITGTWTDDDALDFTTPNTVTTGSKDGNNASNRTAITHTITGLSIPAGATFWIRWNDLDATGADDGLAVDDFSITAAVDTPALTIDDLSQSEGNSGTTTFNFNVHLSSPAPPGGVSFTVNTADGTTNPANAGSDYVAIVNGSGNIPVNQTSTTITVTVNGDMTIEPDETFFVNISNVAGATVSDGQALGTITNDDAPATSAELTVTKTDSPDPVAAGSNITYTITATNNGPDAASNASLTDTVPTNTTFQSLTNPVGWSCTTPAVNGTGTVTCNKSSFAVGSEVFTLVVKVNSATTGGTTISNTASVSSSSVHGTPGNNSAVQTTKVSATAGQVIINEALISSSTSATTRPDFVELYNTTAQAIDISGLVISFRPSGTGNTPSTVTLPGAIGSGTTMIGANSYFMIANGASCLNGSGTAIAADFNASSTPFNLNDTTGGIKIELNGLKLDGLTYQGGATAPNATFIAYGEGTIFTFTATTTSDLVRSSSSADTNDNSADFHLLSASGTLTPKAQNP